MRPIYVSGVAFPTVQAALLHALCVHEGMSKSASYANYPADLLRHLRSDLNAIRDGIAQRAVPDEETPRLERVA